LWRDLWPAIPKSDQTASWFGVLNMPAGLEANLLWATGKERAFVVGGKGNSYMSQGIYSSKEDALEGLEHYLDVFVSEATRIGRLEAAGTGTAGGSAGSLATEF
jgi:hypothetical protein